MRCYTKNGRAEDAANTPGKRTRPEYGDKQARHEQKYTSKMRGFASMDEINAIKQELKETKCDVQQLKIDVAVAKSDISNVKTDISEVKTTMKEMDRKLTDNFSRLQEKQESDRKWKIGLTISSVLTVAGIIIGILIK